jgi:hypothetical protein
MSKTSATPDLLIRSVPGANHIAWQLGHIIGSTGQMLGELGREAPVLPDGFAEEYTAETSALDAPARFATKAEYLTLLDQMKTAILAAIDATPEEDLDKPGPESMREYAPTIGAGLAVLATTGSCTRANSCRSDGSWVRSRYI